MGYDEDDGGDSKTGSHDLILGSYHSYIAAASFIAPGAPGIGALDATSHPSAPGAPGIGAVSGRCGSRSEH